MSDVATIHRPATTGELAALTISAHLEGDRLHIRGGGTHQSFANAAEPPDAVVETTSLNAVIDYSPVDLTLAVQAGCTLASIDTLLRDNGQRLAIDAPCRNVATIGGLFASGLSGPSRLRYGSLKDVVIGAEALNSGGEVTKSGGMVVKNVSGYEVARLHHGAHGAFGIITRLNLKVLPLPESRGGLKLTFREAAEAIEAGTRVITSALDPTAVFVTGGGDKSWMLHVVIEGSRTFVNAQSLRVEALATAGAPAIERDMAELEGAALPEFDSIADLTTASDEIVSRLSAPASKQAQTLASNSGFPGWSVLADLGSGIIYLRCAGRPANVEHIRSIESRAVFLAMPEPLKEGMDVFGGADGRAAPVLRRLKEEFDPLGTFNRGRFVLGL